MVALAGRAMPTVGGRHQNARGSCRRRAGSSLHASAMLFIVLAVPGRKKCRKCQLLPSILRITRQGLIHSKLPTERVAVTDGGSCVGSYLQELAVVDLGCSELLASLPDDSATNGERVGERIERKYGSRHGECRGTASLRSRQRGAAIAVQHWPNVENNGWDVDRTSGHEQGWGSLVASRQQDYTIEWVAVEDLNEGEVGQIAIQRSCWTFAGFLNVACIAREGEEGSAARDRSQL